MTDEEYAIRHERAIKAFAWLYDNYLKKLAAKAREAEAPGGGRPPERCTREVIDAGREWPPRR